MFKRFAESLSNQLRRTAHADRRIQVGLFCVIVFPVALIAAIGFIGTYRDLTAFTLSGRESLARLAGAALVQRFGRVTDLGVSLATRVRLRQLVNEGRWLLAIEILKDVSQDFPFLDRVFLADRAGTLMADVPALPGVRGRNFAFRDWYQGVSADWRPYVSNIYRRAAAPRLNVVALAFPLKAPHAETITGILVLQLHLNELVKWSDSVGPGSSGDIYFIDRNGRLAARSKQPAESELVDRSTVPVVQKVLRGQRGVETIPDPLYGDERIAAYAPVPGVGWGVIASEPTSTALERRNSALKQLLLRHGIILLISCVLAYVILRTVIGLKQAEEKIRTLNVDLQHRANELEATNKELESFSYSVSHDLRSPLRAIDGFSQALLEDCADHLNDQGKDYLGRIRAGSQRMAQLIDDLLDLSRVTRAAITRESINLSLTAESVVAEMQRGDPNRRVDFFIAPGITVTGDGRLLRLAIENLLGNAWKFTGKREEPVIEFGVIHNGGVPAYYVRDNGAGFDMAYMDKLFAPFQRLHAMTEFKGTGIGLATVQRIIHRHGGRVWAEAEVNKGATIYFTLY